MHEVGAVLAIEAKVDAIVSFSIGASLDGKSIGSTDRSNLTDLVLIETGNRFPNHQNAPKQYEASSPFDSEMSK